MLLRILPDYCMYIAKRKSRLPKFLGLYAIRVAADKRRLWHLFAITTNFFRAGPIDLKSRPAQVSACDCQGTFGR